MYIYTLWCHQTWLDKSSRKILAFHREILISMVLGVQPALFDDTGSKLLRHMNDDHREATVAMIRWGGASQGGPVGLGGTINNALGE